MVNVISKKLCLQIYHGVSGLSLVWILRNFFGDICFILTSPFRSFLSNVFPKEPSIWFANLVADLRIISLRLRHSEQVCSIVSSLLFSFPRNLLKDLLDRAGEICVVLIFDIWNNYDWLYSQCWGWVKMINMALIFLGNIKDWGLFLSLFWRLIWFCETAKLSKSVLSNFKRMS